ncbi:alginate lyase family protein [Sporosarcina ureae]|uniref:alginate lyase family protein n=1 Tax=Sporosarcina ureae TaxID=1571 RepID=UPI0028A6793F|nr:alginate lyase family protein [Sporosarcina ureae]
MDNKIVLFVNTVKYLKPSQVFYRVRNRLNRALYKKDFMRLKAPKKITVSVLSNYIIPEIDYNKDYLDRFDIEAMFDNEFSFINLTNKIDLSIAWNNKNLQHLWRYNLHYFEYLFKLSHSFLKEDKQIKYYEKFKEMVINWIDNNPYAYGDGWHPYTISLRLTNWISTYKVFEVMIKTDKDFKEVIEASLYLQYQYLQKNLEKDVLGNHYFENIKGLIIGSVFFNEKKVKVRFEKELLKQLKEQILEDGMHFELSPMYHKIILEDLIKITYWLKDEEIAEILTFYLQKMINVTYSFEEDFGKTPAFNDSADGISKHYQTLIDACYIHFGLIPIEKSDFEISGFYIIKDLNKKIIFDTGEICPTYLPAHGHCDALSFELSLNGSPLIVNSGTYQYEGGYWRDYFRSTKAHNTITISDKEQSQCWGSFRVAKRIKQVTRSRFEYDNIQFYAGSYVSYNGHLHKRYIGYIDEDTIIVIDYVNSDPTDDAKSYLHFTPEAEVQISEKVVYVIKDNEKIKITAIGTSVLDLEQGWYSEQFNYKKKNSHVFFQKENSTCFFGYVIDFSHRNYVILESQNGIRITGDFELDINYEELGAML